MILIKVKTLAQLKLGVYKNLAWGNRLVNSIVHSTAGEAWWQWLQEI